MLPMLRIEKPERSGYKKCTICEQSALSACLGHGLKCLEGFSPILFSGKPAFEAQQLEQDSNIVFRAR